MTNTCISLKQHEIGALAANFAVILLLPSSWMRHRTEMMEPIDGGVALELFEYFNLCQRAVVGDVEGLPCRVDGVWSNRLLEW